MSEPLKPCPNPWCSEVCSRMVKCGPCAFWVRCSCGVCGPCEDSRDDAIAAWNTRKPHDALVATLRALVERLSAPFTIEECAPIHVLPVLAPKEAIDDLENAVDNANRYLAARKDVKL
jgi:hypothetical protein